MEKAELYKVQYDAEGRQRLPDLTRRFVINGANDFPVVERVWYHWDGKGKIVLEVEGLDDFPLTYCDFDHGEEYVARYRVYVTLAEQLRRLRYSRSMEVANE